jgi:hypothetical protein
MIRSFKADLRINSLLQNKIHDDRISKRRYKGIYAKTVSGFQQGDQERRSLGTEFLLMKLDRIVEGSWRQCRKEVKPES